MKRKRTGSLARRTQYPERVPDLGMEPVLGDRTSRDTSCWMAACFAAGTIDDSGEYNGFLKARTSLLKNPMRFEPGHLILPAGGTAELDRAVREAHTLSSERYGQAVASVRAAE